MSQTIALSSFQGQDAVVLIAPDGAQAVVMLQGGQLVSWQPAGLPEQLYCSPTAAFAPGKAVRGGVPVCFPQFGKRGKLAQHGFARQALWQLVMAEQSKTDALCVLRLIDDEATRKTWPHAFALELTVRIQGNAIEIELDCENTGSSPFDFTAALHTYCRLEDLTDARLHGLQGLRYWDAVNGEEALEVDETLRVNAEVDRIYQHARRPLLLREPKHSLQIEQEGFEDVVVWNPWGDKCAALADMPDDDYHQMLCVEAGKIHQPVRLAPGEDWFGRQKLIATQG